jgi:putative iron-regulated protein
MDKPAVFLAFSLGLSACTPAPGPSTPPASEVRPVATTYADVAFRAYSDATTGAMLLDAAIKAFVAAPTAEGLEAAKAAWVAARPAYLETEAFRFYGGPIDGDTGPEALINSWPLDEYFVDYVQGVDGQPVFGGIVNDASLLPTITPQSLAALNQTMGDNSVTAGYHAIEFLLWGQDFSDTGPGVRPFTDYTTAMNAERRGAVLSAASTLLVSDLTQVRDAWDPNGSANYREEFLAAAETTPAELLTRMLKGMGSLSGSELPTERMGVAYRTKEQNDEHSCFSDTTLTDHLHDAIGLENVYLGRYVATDGTRVEGPSLSSLVASRDAALDTRMRQQLAATIAAIRAIPGPFDDAIKGNDDAPGRVAIAAAIEDLHTQTNSIVSVADLFGLQLNLEADSGEN